MDVARLDEYNWTMTHPVLKTDHYKLTMAEAGWPYRHETFYYSHRRGGPHLLPFDPAEEINALNPFVRSFTMRDFDGARRWLEKENGTAFGAWMYGLNESLFHYDVQAPPKGSWICDRDPMFVVSGNSFAVSWLEPLVLQWNYRIQIATLAATEPEALQMEVERVTCNEQKLLIQQTIEAVRQLGYDVPEINITVDANGYYDHVYHKVKALIEAVEDPARIFEVGMRGVTCNAQHMIALQAATAAGLVGTSNIWGAEAFGARSVGTMGHEHVQRFGSDEAAYRAMVERVPGSVFFLLDTFDTYKSGIPTAYQIISEQPERQHAVRFDSGNIKYQFTHAVEVAKQMGLEPRFCLEDGWNLHKTVQFEGIRKRLGLPPSQVLYGYGGHIVNSPFTQLTRDRVSAVWKLTQTGKKPTMKFGNTPGKGKESLPGRPVLYWSRYGTYVAQRGEKISSHFSNYENAFSSGGDPLPNPNSLRLEYNKYYSGLHSPGTKALVKRLTEERNKVIEEIRNAS